MAEQDLQLKFILRRSLADGIVYNDDPELEQLRRSSVHSASPQGSNINNNEDNGRGLVASTAKRLSQNPDIYFHKIGLASTTRAKASRSSRLNTINQSGSSRHPLTGPVCGYGIIDFSSEEEESFSDSDREGKDDGQGISGPLNYSKTTGKATNAPVKAVDLNSPAHYVAHITGRMDPWEMQMQKLQNFGKEVTPEIADKITKDFNAIAKKPSVTTISWARDNEDISQRLQNLNLETEMIKEKRKQEIEARNQAMAKEIDQCLSKVKEEREAAIRIQEEALRRVKLEEERLAKEEEDKKKAMIAQKEDQEKKVQQAATDAADKAKKAAAAAAAAADKVAANSSAVFVSESAEAEWQRYTKVREHMDTVVKPWLVSNPDQKKKFLSARRDVTGNIGKIHNTLQQVFIVAKDIDAIFKNANQAYGANGYNWIMNAAAKKFVTQAEKETEVRVAPAFPIAQVVVLLFQNHPLFLDVLMARFIKKCPYVIPKYFAKEPNESPDDYLRKIGYRRHDKGWENEAQYNARQCGIFTLYCAIMQTIPPAGENLYPISNAWTWMARIINMPPRPITPALLAVFVEVCGERYLSTYRNQANKVLRLLMQDFIPLIPKEGVSASTRLKTKLEDFYSTGRLPVPEGREFD
ncbi:hypothetical protein BG011_007603 [Mortierella polycephala]|uniref:mRNA export factor GLE1 n=1 Tax=Mortierella polycephala TaxID=41804 RepID=A0A9P6PRZ4_9FUNG|nr:hypothetical protein BG011_007603 [Mortierella polycephala]